MKEVKPIDGKNIAFVYGLCDVSYEPPVLLKEHGVFVGLGEAHEYMSENGIDPYHVIPLTITLHFGK